VRGAAPLLQVVHVDDLVSALALVATRDLPGVYNVAADGWLAPEEARELVTSSPVPSLPAEALERVLRRTWELGIGDVPPGVVPYLTHPWVIANDKLHGAGWAPARTNADAIAEARAALPPRRRARTTAAAGAVGLSALGAAVAVRRRRRRA
jgi:nucleoside-diphosphate-sugar epimerase